MPLCSHKMNACIRNSSYICLFHSIAHTSRNALKLITFLIMFLIKDPLIMTSQKVLLMSVKYSYEKIDAKKVFASEYHFQFHLWIKRAPHIKVKFTFATFFVFYIHRLHYELMMLAVQCSVGGGGGGGGHTAIFSDMWATATTKSTSKSCNTKWAKRERKNTHRTSIFMGPCVSCVVASFIFSLLCSYKWAKYKRHKWFSFSFM